MKYTKGDMLYSISGACWYYVINRHKGIKQGNEVHCYLVRRLARPTESYLTNFKKDYLDTNMSFIYVGNYPAYNWEGFMKNGDKDMLDATDQALIKIGSPVRVGTSHPVSPNIQVPRVVLPPKVVSKITKGTFIKPEEKVAVTKKKQPGDDIDCHCGSYFIGVTQKGKGHSSWCPMFKE